MLPPAVRLASFASKSAWPTPISSLAKASVTAGASSVKAGAGSDVCRILAALGRDLLHGVIEVQERDVAGCLVQRMHIAPLQVLNDAGFEGLRVGEFHDAHGNGIESGQLRRAVAPRPGYDLVAVALGPNQEGREHALTANRICEFVEAVLRQTCGAGLPVTR